MNKENIAVLLMAGAGVRFSKSVKKQFLVINNHEAFVYPLLTLIKSQLFSHILVVCNSSDILHVEQTIEKENIDNSSLYIIAGGNSRNMSVFNALEFIKNNLVCENVLIHDAARVCLNKEITTTILNQLDKYDAVTAAMPIVDSIVDSVSGEYIDRNNKYYVQTPQAFNFTKIYDIYSQHIDESSTDDYSKAITNGLSRCIVLGDISLLKITFPSDKIIVEKLLK